MNLCLSVLIFFFFKKSFSLNSSYILQLQSPLHLVSSAKLVRGVFLSILSPGLHSSNSAETLPDLG